MSTGYENHDTAELKRLLAEPDDYIGPPVKKRIKKELAKRKDKKAPETHWTHIWVMGGHCGSCGVDANNAKASELCPARHDVEAVIASEPVVKVVLPWDTLCSVNERQNPHSGFTLTRKYRKALKQARKAVEAQYQGPKITGPVTATFEFYPPSRRPDLPNYLKLPMDAMEGIIYENDRQVNAGGQWKWMYIDKLEPRVEVTVQHTTDSKEAA